jgi:hypothetical protein
MELPKPQGGNFELIPAGTFTARCYRFIDLGSHEQTFQGESKGLKRLVMVGFELPTELMEDGRPFSIHKRWTWSTHEKANMRKDLESWRGAKFNDSDFGPGGFNVKNLLGVPCTISIVHTEKGNDTFANITSIGKAMKGIDIPPMINKPTYLSLDYKEFDREVFDGLSEKLRAFITESPEYKSLMAGVSHSYAETKGNGRAHYDQSPLVPAGQREFAPTTAYQDMDDEIPF